MQRAYVEDIASGELIEVLHVTGNDAVRAYKAARDAARRDGAPDRIKWHFGKGHNDRMRDAGRPVRDWCVHAGKRYVLVEER